MQIKKNPRDEGYQDASSYDDDAKARIPSFDPPSDTVTRNKTRDGENAVTDQDPAPRPVRAESVLDAESAFDGRYEAAQDLRILGSLTGEVVCRGLLTVERDATAKAKIQARDAQVRGRVEGDIVCTGRLLLTASAVVSGTIKAATLVIEEGASLSGNVQTSPNPASVLNETPAPAPLAAVPPAADEAEPAADATSDNATGSNRGSGGRWTSRTREVPSFALVSSEERTADRN